MPSPTKSHTHWMSLALKVAETALPADVPVGAVLVRGDQIIAQGANCREKDHNPVGHAEIMVLMEAGQKLGKWRLSDTILYVTLEPCPMCAAAIAQARIPMLVFGAPDPLYGACGSQLNLCPGLTIIGGILEEPCRELLKDFFGRLKDVSSHADESSQD